MASIKLSITEPCHENWNAMLPEEKGRFCLSCQKTVVDFTAMTDRQVFDYFKNYKSDTCGQFSNDQLDRELTKPKTHSIGRWKYFWQILLPAFFAFQKIEAQPKLRGKVAATPICKPVKEEKPQIRMMGMVMPHQSTKSATSNLIYGNVVNEKKKPVPFATVTSSDGKYAVADSSGHFKILLSDKASLTITQVGYNQRNFTIDSLQTVNISGLKLENGQVVIETTIELQQKDLDASEVIVAGYGSVKKLTGRAGGITVSTSKTLFTKQKTQLPDNSLPQLKIFPNPIHPGHNFQVTFQVKKAGGYILRVIDAAGRITIEKRLNVLSKTITETINGAALQQPGIYFINIKNPADKKGKELNGRLLVQ